MKFFTWLLIVVLLGAGAWLYLSSHRTKEMPLPDSAATQEQAQGKAQQTIREQVAAFGDVLKNISLLSPSAASDIEKTYSPYVSRSLRARWEAHPDTALGRETSSPWPDHIDVVSIDVGANNTYVVRAIIVFMTSNEVEKGGDAGTSTVQFTMVNEDAAWKIDNVTILQQNEPNATRTSEDRPQLE